MLIRSEEIFLTFISVIFYRFQPLSISLDRSLGETLCLLFNLMNHDGTIRSFLTDCPDVVVIVAMAGDNCPSLELKCDFIDFYPSFCKIIILVIVFKQPSSKFLLVANIHRTLQASLSTTSQFFTLI